MRRAAMLGAGLLCLSSASARRRAERRQAHQGSVRSSAADDSWASPSTTWPLPQATNGNPGTCSGIAPGLKISTVGFSDEVLVAAAKRYEQIFFVYGPNTAAPQTPPSATISVVNVDVLTSDDELRFGIDESYNLTVSGTSATVSANTVFGALWGLETLSQLIHRVWSTGPSGAVNASYYQVCEATIQDAPRFPYRGLLIDTSRHFLAPTAIKQVIDMMSYLKMNALHVHFTDDQSWPLYIPALPVITNVTAYSPLHVYASADLVDLIQYARLRGVVIYPEIDLPEHSYTLIQAIPDIGCLVPTPAPGYRCLLDPLYPQLWPTLKAIWSAMDEVFPKAYPFHMGGDEVEVDCWTTCPNATAWAKKNGLDPTNGYNAYHWFESTLYNMLVKDMGRTVVAWEDITGLIDGNFTDVGNKLVLEQWDGAPGTWNWDTCDQLATNATGVIVSGPFTILSTPQLNYVDVANLTCPITPRVAQQLWGPEIMLWDDAQDTSGSDILVSAMQTLMAVAESSWSAQAVVRGQSIDTGRYTDHRCRLASRGVTSHPGVYAPTGTYCMTEYTGTLAPWSQQG